jgi:DNA repair protein RecN
MLVSLTIHQIAVIQSVQIEFDKGLNILTGETGAGKSIIIDALNMILGNRVSKNLIRTGEESASVSAIFMVQEEVQDYLSENGFPCEEGELMLYREINVSGKSTIRINGKLATASILKEIADSLVNIHGQHDNQSLMNPEKHLHILDEFCNNEKELYDYRQAYHRYRQIEKELSKFHIDEEEKIRRQRMLEFEIQEIEAADLKANEEEELTEKRNILSNAQNILKNVSRAYELLYGSANAYEDMGDAVKCIEQASRYDTSLDQIKDSAYDVYYNMESVAESLRHYRDGFEYDEAEVNEIEARLSLINDLKRRYGGSLAYIQEYLMKAKEDLSGILHLDEKLSELKVLYSQAEKKLQNTAEILTESRKKAAVKLEQQIMSELSELNMPNTKFHVSFSMIEDTKKFTEYGQEKIEFLLSANVGQNMDKLSKIASGGELSRIMLAIKSAVFEQDGAETLIFDEIDTGVSGRAAQKIAEKLYKVSKNRQVLCVTHLPQIAAMADHHYLIEKNVVADETLTTVSHLNEAEKVQEIARIIGGVKITDSTLENAGEMLALSRMYKREK